MSKLTPITPMSEERIHDVLFEFVKFWSKM